MLLLEGCILKQNKDMTCLIDQFKTQRGRETLVSRAPTSRPRWGRAGRACAAGSAGAARTRAPRSRSAARISSPMEIVYNYRESDKAATGQQGKCLRL